MSASGPGERCPVCGRDSDDTVRPFCSRRCADVDLGRWLTGAYAIPVEEEDEDRPAERDGAGRPEAGG